MNILHICANPKPIEESASKQLATTFFSNLVTLNQDVEINNVDLYENTPPFLSNDAIRAFWYPVSIEGYQATDTELKAAQYGIDQAKQLCAADVLVLTTPMWNFSLPAIMKAWIDMTFAPGHAFDITAKGVTPKHKIQKVVLLAASGGVYKEGDKRDVLLPQLEAAFGFIGIDDFDIAWADGQNTMHYKDSEERKSFALEAAQEIAEDVASLTVPA